MNLFLATLVTSMLLSKTKNAVELAVKLNRPNFMQRVGAVASGLTRFGTTLNAANYWRKLGWFSEDSPEQLADWATEIVNGLIANGAAGSPVEAFVDLANLGVGYDEDGNPEDETDDIDISVDDLEDAYNEAPAEKED